MDDMDDSTIMRAFEDIINPGSITRVADLGLLRRICSRGIPDDPPWIRPRVWKLLLGCLPPQKDEWASESRKSRERYYDLATQFLDEVERMPEPTVPLGPRDKLLDTIAKDVERTQPRVPFFHSPIEPSPFSPLSPLPHGFVLSPTEEDGSTIPDRIESAAALFDRLELVRGSSRHGRTRSGAKLGQPLSALNPPKTPEIRLSPSIESSEFEGPPPPPPPKHMKTNSLELSMGDDLPTPTASTPTMTVSSPSTQPTKAIELLSSRALPKPLPKHSQILLRILYLFSVTHPHQAYIQGLNELLAPLYMALCMDLDEQEYVHAEADAFWLFTELIGEMGAVIGEPGDWKNPAPVALAVAPGAAGSQNGVKGAMAEFSARLKWADIQLWEDLARKSLDPALPYYSYRWIACLLAQDLPLHAILRVWDTIFAQPPSTPDSNPRLAFLINICTSMLIRIRDRLIRTGNIKSHSGGLWGDEYIDADAVMSARTGVPAPAAPVPGFESETKGVMGEGFIEGMMLLQAYPLKAIGLDMIINGAWVLADRMRQEELQRLQGPSTMADVGTRLRQRFWSGATAQSVPEEEEEDGDSEDEATEKETERIDTATATETPTVARQGVFPAVKLRQYAEAIKSSDTAASVSKASTNWTAVALDVWKSRSDAGGPSTTNGSSSSKPLPPSGSSRPQSPPNASSQSLLPPTQKLRQYAEAIRSSDTAASLSKVSTNWTVAALDRWNRPTQPSPLNPASPSTSSGSLPPEPGRNRGSSISSWTSWGAAKTGGLWNRTNPSSPTSDSQPTSQTMSESEATGRDNRTSLPVPMRPSHSVDNRRRSPNRSTDLSSARYSPPPRPAHFARPRDSFAGLPEAHEVPQPLQEALAKVSALGSRAIESSQDEGVSTLGKSLQSAFATLTGSPGRPPSPPDPPPKSAPRPLLLGTPAAKTAGSPSQQPKPLVDSRPSSMSSTTSARSSTIGPITPTPRSSQGTSIHPDSPAGSVASDNERKVTGGFIPLRNGVGRHTASAALVRKSRAARVRTTVDFSQMEGFESRSNQTSPTDSVPDLSSPALNTTTPKKFSLTDKPLAGVDTVPTEDYSSGSSIGGPVLRGTRLKAKRTYPTRPLRVVTSESPDPYDVYSPGVGRSETVKAANDTPRGSERSTLAISKTADDGLRTPTSAEKDSARSPRSPRRLKKVPSHGRIASVAMSEEEGTKGDDEDGYGDLLSAYSEDDGAERPRSFAG